MSAGRTPPPPPSAPAGPGRRGTFARASPPAPGHRAGSPAGVAGGVGGVVGGCGLLGLRCGNGGAASGRGVRGALRGAPGAEAPRPRWDRPCGEPPGLAGLAGRGWRRGGSGPRRAAGPCGRRGGGGSRRAARGPARRSAAAALCVRGAAAIAPLCVRGGCSPRPVLPARPWRCHRPEPPAPAHGGPAGGGPGAAPRCGRPSLRRLHLGAAQRAGPREEPGLGGSVAPGPLLCCPHRYPARGSSPHRTTLKKPRYSF